MRRGSGIDLTGRVFGRLTVVDMQGDGVLRARCLCSCGKQTSVKPSALTSGSRLSCGCARREVKPAHDKTGQVFGWLTVLDMNGPRPAYAHCRCACGTDVNLKPGALTSGNTTSCGCKVNSLGDLTGQVFGRLTVLDMDGPAGRRAHCRCACGKEVNVRPKTLVSGNTGSCGCWEQESRKQAKGPRADYTGERKGKLTVTGMDGPAPAYVRCLCDCGREVAVTPHRWKSGAQGSCGCMPRAMPPNFVDVEEAERRLIGHFPQYEFPYLREEWTGAKSSTLTIVCADHGAQVARKHSRDLWAGNICFACGMDKRMASAATGTSAGEQDLRAFLSVLEGTALQAGFLPSVGQWHFDVLLPRLKIAVEYNGVYWHSYPRAHRGQHLHKRLFAESHGWRMVTIWEDDWTMNRPAVERYLRRLVAGAQVSVGARKLNTTEVGLAEAQAFHALHHLQGAGPTRATLHLGLKDADGDVIGVASFGSDGVLHRYTVADGVAIHGGLRKLIAASGFNEVVTYCDRDHFTGKVYAAAGFACVGKSMQLTYVEGNKRVRRERYMKKNLSLRWDDVDHSMTEHEICAAHGVWAAYNSGVDKWVWRSQ